MLLINAVTCVFPYVSIWRAVSRPHLPFDKDLLHYYLELLECVCLKVDIHHLTHAMGNPFKVVL